MTELSLSFVWQTNMSLESWSPQTWGLRILPLIASSLHLTQTKSPKPCPQPPPVTLFPFLWQAELKVSKTLAEPPGRACMLRTPEWAWPVLAAAGWLPTCVSQWTFPVTTYFYGHFPYQIQSFLWFLTSRVATCLFHLQWLPSLFSGVIPTPMKGTYLLQIILDGPPFSKHPILSHLLNHVHI
jgi:hypothetical protein